MLGEYLLLVLLNAGSLHRKRLNLLMQTLYVKAGSPLQHQRSVDMILVTLELAKCLFWRDYFVVFYECPQLPESYGHVLLTDNS